MSNYDLLVKAGIIDPGYPPDATDMATINNVLKQDDVNGLINVFKAVGSPFLVKNCNGGGGTVTPGSGNSRVIGIVF